MKHCTQDGYLVFFGTGKYLEETDLTDTTLQTIYAVWDYGDDVDDTEYAGDWDNVNEILTNARLPSGVGLQDQDASEYVVDGKLIRVMTDNVPDWTPTTLSGGGLCGNYGGNTSCDMNSPGTQPEPAVDVAWFMNLPGSGERIVSDMLIREGKLIVISYIPEGTMCGTGGSSWLMEFNACTGARLASSIFDRDEDGDIDEDDQVKINPGTGEVQVVPTGINFDGRLQPPAIIIFGDGTEVLYMSSSKGKIETQRQQSARLGVVYWRIFRP
jgi:type IV pilus assembly protein PilY1